MSRFEWFLAWRYLRFNSGRSFLSVITWISVAGVAVGTAALVVALALNAGFAEDIRERIHTGSAHLTVLGPRGTTFEGAEGLVQTVLRVEGVEAAGPVLFTPAMLVVPGVGQPEFAEVVGVDPAVHAEVIREIGWEQSPFPRIAETGASGRGAVVLGEGLARKLGVIEGEPVQVVVAGTSLAPWGPVPRQRLFDVRAVYRSDQFEQDSRRAYVDLAALQRLMKLDGQVSWVEIRLEDLRDIEPMKQRLQLALGAEWTVIDLLEWNSDFLAALNLEKLLLFLSIGLIVVVASLNIVSTLILAVNDKVKEIGTLSAMGARPRAIALVFVVQGLVVGLIGVVVGLPLGAGIASTLDALEWPKLNPEVYYLTHVPFSVDVTDVLSIGAAALLIALLATIYPAWKAASLDPVEALRYE